MNLFDPNTKIGALRKLVFDLLKEHEDAGEDGLPTNARFLFYELVQRGVLQKHDPDKKGGRRADSDLHVALTDLREEEIIPWDWIIDEIRSLEDYTGWSSLKEAVLSRAEYARLDPWQGHAPLILTESRAVAGALRKLAEQYAVKIAPVGGHVAGFLHNDIAPTLSEGDRVLYIGDWDWQGHQIENNTRRVLERKVGSLNWKRLALTEEQVDHYDLRRLQIMKIDRRYTPGHPGYRFPAVETEALKQQVIVQIVRDALDGELPESIERVHEREEQQRQEVVGVLAEIDDEQ
jgi:hypothetical protein